MIEEVLFTLLGLLLAFQVGMMLTLKRCEALVLALNADLENASPQATIDSIRDEMGDIIEHLMGTMRTPTIADHLGGVISQFAQVRLMKMMQAEGMMPDGPGAIEEGASLD